MVFTVSKLLVCIAMVCAIIAVIAVIFDVRDAHVWPASMALSLVFGWASMLLP